MRKISDSVHEIISSDDSALESHRRGMLNLSAYADQIHQKVEQMTTKSVKRGSIVVALARLGTKLKNISPLRPTVKIQNLSIMSPLCELTYEKTIKNLKELSNLNSQAEFLTVTRGVNEFTIIFSQNKKDQIKSHFHSTPKGEYPDLSAITVSFDESEYIEVPNMIYSLISLIAAKRINLIEIVSTFTEISFIVRNSDTQATVSAFLLATK